MAWGPAGAGDGTVGAYGSWMARLDSGGSLNSEYGNGEGGQHRTNALLRDEMSSLLPRLEAGRVLGHRGLGYLLKPLNGRMVEWQSHWLPTDAGAGELL